MIPNRVRETTVTTGNGLTIALSAVTGRKRFSTAGAGTVVPYTLEDANGVAWEIGRGTVQAGNTLDRTTVLESTNSGSRITLSAGTHRVFSAVDSTFFNADGASITNRCFLSMRTNFSGLKDENGVVPTQPTDGSSYGISLPFTTQAGDSSHTFVDPNGWMQEHPSAAAETYSSGIVAAAMSDRTLLLPPGMYIGSVFALWNRLPDTPFIGNDFWTTVEDTSASLGPINAALPSFGEGSGYEGEPVSAQSRFATGYFAVDGDEGMVVATTNYIGGATGADMFLLVLNVQIVKIA